MKTCELLETPDIELYFYDELDAPDRARVDTHLGGCRACRQRLDDLHAIRAALAAEPRVDAPPAGDWSGFMRRLDAAIAVTPAAAAPAAVVKDRWSTVRLTAIAATIAALGFGTFLALRVIGERTGPRAGAPAQQAQQQPAPGATAAAAAAKGDRAFREVSVEHLERSKLVVLGLATRDPRTRAADWEHERELAGNLLSDTRLYRIAAQERGAEDVAHVMRDLETVLLEASMSDASDRESLERVQRLIARRGLVSKMQVVTTSAGL